MFFPDPSFKLPRLPQRIISLVPSQTELLYDLGLEKETVGITKFCIHPESWFRSKTRIGGTKSLHIEKIKALQPDLIIANKEENVKEQVATLSSVAPVWMSDIHNLEDALGMIRSIGVITGREEKAQIIATKIGTGFHDLVIPAVQPETLYLIWRDPWMTIGKDTFIHDIMQRTGLHNIYADQDRYPAISLEDIAARAPEVVLLSSEPYPFKEKHIAGLQEVVPRAKILLVDGELFSWYGSRLLHAPAYLSALAKDIRESIRH